MSNQILARAHTFQVLNLLPEGAAAQPRDECQGADEPWVQEVCPEANEIPNQPVLSLAGKRDYGQHFTMT